jgi:threonine dehydratase
MGLEILEDLPDVRTVICAIGGGGLITGVGSAIKAKKLEAKVLGAEPETAAPYALSLREGAPRKFENWQASFVDGAGGKSVIERMWQRMQPVVDGSITVTLDQTRDAMRLIAEKSRTIAEGAGALALAAALKEQSLEGPIVCVVSGGNIDLVKFCELVAH